MTLSPDMENSLSYHRPDVTQTQQIEALRDAQKCYWETVESLCPPGRELAVARTYFETSAMWAVKSIVVKAPKE